MGQNIYTKVNRFIESIDNEYYEYTQEDIDKLQILEDTFFKTFPNTNRFSGGRYFLFETPVPFGKINGYDTLCTHYRYNEADKDIFFNVVYNKRIDTSMSIENYYITDYTTLSLNDIRNGYSDRSRLGDDGKLHDTVLKLEPLDTFLDDAIQASKLQSNINLSKYMIKLYDLKYNIIGKVIGSMSKKENEHRLEYEYKHELYFMNIEQEYLKNNWLEVKNMSDNEYNTIYLDKINRQNKIAMDILNDILNDERSKL